MQSNYIVIYLKPGELYACSDPVIIKTVLGSCIAVCLHDSVNKVGGANHFLLPTAKREDPNILNYGDRAIEALLDRVLAEGGEKRHLTAQVIGGSCSYSDRVVDVGAQNIRMAQQVLQNYGIPVIRQDTGGKTGRVIRFNPMTGEVQLKQAGSVEQAKPQPGERFVQLSTVQKEFLQSTFRTGLARGEKSFATLVGTKVQFEPGEVMLRKMSYAQGYINSRFSDLVITTGPKNTAPIGEVVMMLAPNKVGDIVNSLLRRSLKTQLRYDRMEVSVIVELGNIVINAILGTLANQLGFDMMLRVPQIMREREKLKNLSFMSLAREYKLCLATKTRLIIPAWDLDVLLLLLVEIGAPHTFLRKLSE